jgi:preprotein translocase subunit SecA
LVEYQREGYDLFAAMMDGIKEESVGFLFNLEVQVEEAAEEPLGEAPIDPVEAPTDADEPRAAAEHPHIVAKGLGPPRVPQQLTYSAPDVDGEATEGGGVEVIDEYGDVPRNSPCPCGSGRKFKRCHGDPAQRALRAG